MNSNEMRKNLESDIQNLNGLILENKPNDEIAKLLHGVSENVSKLNLMVMNEEFSVLRASDKPMYNAIMSLEVSKITLGQDKENGKYMLVDGKKIIDLAAFNRFCEPQKISNESGWVYRGITWRVCCPLMQRRNWAETGRNCLTCTAWTNIRNVLRKRTLSAKQR